MANGKRRKALTPEARENQLLQAAMDEAERRILDGTASSQLLVEFLRRGSTKTQHENAKLEAELDLLRAKTEALKNAKTQQELYDNAIAAMRRYSGVSDELDDVETY